MRKARVHIVYGSKSDEEPIRSSGMVDILSKILGDEDVFASSCSAHRNTEELADYVAQACDNGAEAFIGVAGLAAALPGALAGNSKMVKSIIAVPLDEHGIDSCLYMPPGVPVALAGVGVPGLKNAAQLACQILGTGDDLVYAALCAYLGATAKQPEFDVDINRLKKEKVA